MPSPNLLQTKTQSKTKTRLAWAIVVAAAAAFAGYILSQRADAICASYPTFCERFAFWQEAPDTSGEGTSTNSVGESDRNANTRTFEAEQQGTTYTNELVPNGEKPVDNSLVPNPEPTDNTTDNTLVPNDSDGDPVTNSLEPNSASDTEPSGGQGTDPEPKDTIPSGGQGTDPVTGDPVRDCTKELC